MSSALPEWWARVDPIAVELGTLWDTAVDTARNPDEDASDEAFEGFGVAFSQDPDERAKQIRDWYIERATAHIRRVLAIERGKD